ncbi:MAG: PilZ domain-containing protein, partial [Acidiferrobacterales bacterium]|nr:PilZ domain-containing protein [Acidiferrobacterales bacterium]
VLPIGLATTLSFTAPWMRAPIQVDAKVISRVESGASRIYRYRLKFDSDELKRRLSREASRVYNQRTANRVTPPPGESVAVALKLPAADRSLELPTNATADVSVTGRLKDISTGGVGVFLGRKAENVLADTELVEISFELPPSSEPLTLMGWIRHRRLKGNRMSYGIEFDTELSKNFAPQLDRINHYIVRHQEQE